MKKIFLILLLLLGYTQNLYSSEAYEFTKDAINIFGSINEASEGFEKAPINSENMPVMLSSLLKNSIKMKNIADDGIYTMKKYEKSRDSEIVSAVSIFSGALTIMKITHERSTQIFEKYLNNIQVINKNFGTMQKEMLENSNEQEKQWETMNTGAIGISYGIVDLNRLENGKTCCLKISNQERSDLKKLLIRNFGIKIADGIDKNNMKRRIGAAGIYMFLNDNNWKSKDQK